MLYIFGIIFATLLVVGQTLYKYAVDKAAFEPTVSYIFSGKMASFLLSWQFLAGLGAFIAASLISFWMLTKFQFSSIQAVTVPVVMALSYVVGAWLFKDVITPLNMFGLLVLIVGVVLASIK